MVSRGCVKRLAGDTLQRTAHTAVGPVPHGSCPGTLRRSRLLSLSEVSSSVWQSIWLLYSHNSGQCASKYSGGKKKETTGAFWHRKINKQSHMYVIDCITLCVVSWPTLISCTPSCAFSLPVSRPSLLHLIGSTVELCVVYGCTIITWNNVVLVDLQPDFKIFLL